MKKKTYTSHSSSYLLRYTLPIFIIVLVFTVFGFILFRQRKLELSSLELRLQMQASLLSEKISSRLHTHEMTISLLDLDSSRANLANKEEHTLFENEIRKQLLLQDGLDKIFLYSINGKQLYTSNYTDKAHNTEIDNLIENHHVKQEKEFAIAPLYDADGIKIVMSRVLHRKDSAPHAILALVIDTKEFFDPLIISSLEGMVKASLYDSKGTIFALWYNDSIGVPSLDTSITNISQLSQFSNIRELELQDSCIKGGVRIVCTKDAYIPLAKLANFPYTVALHVDIPTAMKAYDGATYINLIAIFILLVILLFINHRLHHQRSAKETLQQHMLEELTTLVQQRTEELEKLSSQDFLTGLMNRRQLNLLIEKEVENNKLLSTPFSLIAIDLDSFKQINDTYGHIIGDKVLIHTCEQLIQAVGENGYISRWGGDELMILLPNIKGSIAFTIGEALCTHVENNRFNGDILCTISLGVAEYEASEELISLIRRADAALYEAKDLGKNRAILAKGTS